MDFECRMAEGCRVACLGLSPLRAAPPCSPGWLLPPGVVRAHLPPEDMHKIITHTEGYSGSDMRHLIQEACQVHGRACISLPTEKLEGVSFTAFHLSPTNKYSQEA